MYRLIILIFLLLGCNIENEDMKMFQASLPSKQSLGYFEDIFLKNQDYVESRVRMVVGQLQTLDVYTDKVILATYELDTKSSDGEYIQFGRLSLRHRDDIAGIGDHIIFLTTETVIPFAFKPVVTENAWIPWHSNKTAWSFDGNIPKFNIDGTEYELYTDTFDWKTFDLITVDQNIFGVVTLQGVEPVNPDRVIDGVMEVNTKLTITRQQLIQESTFKVTQQINYVIGYSPMWSVDGNAMKYKLLQNGNKFLTPIEDGTQNFNDDIYSVGYNSDEDFGCAFISTDADGIWWVEGGKCDRYIIKSQGGTKQKMYYEMLRGSTPLLNSTYHNITKYIWGQSNNFQTIYDAAPIENS